MLSIGLSVNEGVRMLERALKSHVEGIGKLLMDGEHTTASKKVVAHAEAFTSTKEPGLRVAKTTYPDQRLDFNQTFEHIRYELGAMYKIQRPRTSSAAAPQPRKNTAQSAGSNQQRNEQAQMHVVGRTLGFANNDRMPQGQASLKGLKVAKTVYPDQPLDFNNTFRHIHAELRQYPKRA